MTIYEYIGISKETLRSIDVSRSYMSYRIKKSDGKRTRRIDAPLPGLKQIQKTILHKLLYRYKAHDIAHGFVIGRSPKTNAEKHVGKKYLMKFDLKDFFRSISMTRVERCLTYLCSDKRQSFFEEPDEVTILQLAHILCLNGSLPQGAPTSPTFTNLVCYGMDRELDKLQALHACTITRYADDIAISLDDKCKIDEVAMAIFHIAHRFGFTLNKRKTKICSQANRQKITGVVVNKQLNTPKEVWRNLRAALHHASFEGISEKQLQQLRGRIEWLRSLAPLRGNQYLTKLGQISVKVPSIAS